MTLVHTPEAEHSCDIDWEAVPWPVPDQPTRWNPGPPPGVTHRAQMVYRNDAPGTVRRCEECGRHWVAVKNRPGMAGVYWRTEKRRERRRRERAAKR